MRRLFTLASLLVAMMVSSCTYDDSALLSDLNALKDKVENLENRVDEQQVLLNALANQLTIVSIDMTSEGYIITFSDNSTLVLNHGKDGKDGIDGQDGAIVGVEWDDDSATFTLADGTIIVVPLEIVETPEIPDTPVIPDTPTVGIEAVDLGLSVKWASCNVGANSPEDYGDYFAWGEISPKEEYSTQTYQYWTDYNGNGSWDSGEFSYLGDISGNPQYDAATANWGGAWRMPTRSEIGELIENCTWEWTSLNGVNGYKVTGPNGNSIFLPAAGFRYGTSSGYVGSYGGYWSSTPYEDYDGDAFSLYFGSDFYDWYWHARSNGQPVRPVLE